MIKIKNIYKSYNDKRILKGVNYVFNNKGLYWIKGKSGSGKTTLLNIISNRIKQDEGEVISDEGIFYFSFSDYLIDDFTVQEIIDLHSQMYLEFSEYEQKFGIDQYLNKKVKKLSGGEKQRLGIFLALSSNQNHILLDEPLAGVDLYYQKIILDELKKVSKKRLIILTSHQEVKGSKVIYLENGVLLGDYKDKEVLEIKQEKRKLKGNNLVFLLHKKQWISRIVFIISIISLLITSVVVKEKLYNIKKEFYNNISDERIYYKKNEGELNTKIFYDGILRQLAYEVKDYYVNIYAPEMVNDQLYIGNYILGDASLFSSSIEDMSLKNNEIALILNSNEFCIRNNIQYCYENQIREELIGREVFLKYKKGVKNYVLRDLFFDSYQAVYVNDNLSFIEELRTIYDDYYLDYYLVIKNSMLNEFYKKINTKKSLLLYDYLLISQEDDESLFVVLESQYEYFSYLEFNQENIIACSDIGYSCNTLNFSSINSLKYIDDYNLNGLVKYKKYSSIYNYNEIGISIALANTIKKGVGDSIDLRFYFDDSFYNLEDVVIKEIINDNDLCLYHAKYDYDLYKDKFNKYLHISYVSGEYSGDNMPLLGYDIIKEGVDYLENIVKIIKVVMEVFFLVSIIILFWVERNKLKKHLSVFRCLVFNHVECLSLLKFYLLIYLALAIVLLVRINICVIYILVFSCFYILSIQKIKSRVNLD